MRKRRAQEVKECVCVDCGAIFKGKGRALRCPKHRLAAYLSYQSGYGRVGKVPDHIKEMRDKAMKYKHLLQYDLEGWVNAQD